MDIEKIKTQICDNYCKHVEEIRATFEDIDRGQEELDRICDRCPMNELEDAGFGSTIKISKNDKVIIESTVFIKKDAFKEIAETIKKQFNESQLIFLPNGITAKVVSSDVIPCGECLHYKPLEVMENGHICEVHNWQSKACDFCSFAERRNDE